MAADPREQVVLRLFHEIDRNDAAQVARLFCVKGVWQRGSSERIGRAAITAEMMARPAGRRIQHLITNFLILADTVDQAEVTFKTLAFADTHPCDDAPSPMNHPIALDVYAARLVVVGGGWLVSRLGAERMFAS